MQPHSMVNGHYTITLQGNTPQGTRKSWTFVIDDSGVWHDSATGQQMSVDAQYILAALQYVSSPLENTVTKKVSNSLSTAVSTMPKGVAATVNLLSLVSKSSQYTQSIHNQSVNTNFLLPKIVVSSNSPIVQNTGILPFFPRKSFLDLGAKIVYYRNILTGTC